MQFDYAAVGIVVKRLRIKKGLSQEVVSGLAGIARTHLTMIENGTKKPNLETLWRIAQALDIATSELIRQVEEDRIALSELAGYEVVGMAYPGGTHVMNEHVADLIRENTGVKYARTTTSTHNFDLQTNLHIFNPTVYHHVEWDKLFALGEQFISLKPDRPQIYYIWGHAYEFDIHGDWERFEQFCQLISGKSDIFYGTNRQVLLNED